MVVGQLTRLAEQTGPEEEGAWRERLAIALVPAGGELTPRVDLRIDELAVGASVVGVAVRDQAAYSAVPETRIGQASSAALSLGLNARAQVSGPAVSFSLGARARYAVRGPVPWDLDSGVVTTEETDDLVFDADFQVLRFAPPLAPGIRPVPYLRATYDTEFTRGAGPDAADDARHQRLLRFDLGVSTLPQSGLRDLRVGAFVELDLAADVGVDPVGGLAAQVNHRHTVVERKVYWTNTAQLLLYLLPLPYDDAERLLLRLEWRTALTVQLQEGLALDVHADLFAFQGRDLVTDADGDGRPDQGFRAVGAGRGLAALGRVSAHPAAVVLPTPAARVPTGPRLGGWRGSRRRARRPGWPRWVRPRGRRRAAGS